MGTQEQITYCCDCANSFFQDSEYHSGSKKDSYYWRCRAVKLPLIKDLVTGITSRTGTNDLGGSYPEDCDFAQCCGVNDGKCRYFKAQAGK